MWGLWNLLCFARCYYTAHSCSLPQPLTVPTEINSTEGTTAYYNIYINTTDGWSGWREGDSKREILLMIRWPANWQPHARRIISHCFCSGTKAFPPPFSPPESLFTVLIPTFPLHANYPTTSTHYSATSISSVIIKPELVGIFGWRRDHLAMIVVVWLGYPRQFREKQVFG